MLALSQLIVTSRYLKSGNQKSKNKRRNYTKYIATRETIEVREQKQYDLNVASTEKQKEILNELITDFPEAKRYLEYEDFITNPTVGNASELINTIIERNADVIGNRQNFVGYMAMRPGVEKRGTHGLFNESDEPIVLDRVANEIANHKGNVWSHVVSLRREDAVRLGYDNSEVWRDLVKRHISDIAKAQRIPLCNLKWYAAFHDTTHHPHIHLLVYSTNPKQGFLTKEGIDKIRSAFANDIFHDDLQSIYMEQTISRDELKAVSKTELENIVDNIRQANFDCPMIEGLVRKLYSQLQNVKGKKVYGYLPPEVKQTVNDIFSELAKDENVSKLYEKWCDMERLKYKTYTQKGKELPALTENKVFQPVRNMIIRTVLDMNKAMVDVVVQDHELIVPNPYDSDVEFSPLLDESEQSTEECTVTINTADLISESKYYLKWSKNYKEACKLIYNKNSKLEDFKKAEQLLLTESQNGNVLAIHDLGKLYSTDKLGEKDLEKSQKYYSEALKGFHEIEPTVSKLKSYVQYRICMMYKNDLDTDIDVTKAIEYFQRSADNKWSSYQLGKLYLFGADGLEKDKEEAIRWLTKSADAGNEYAQKQLDDINKFENAVLANTVIGLFVNLSRCIEEDYVQKYQSVRRTVDRKLRQMILKKKQELGVKEENNITMQ